MIQIKAKQQNVSFEKNVEKLAFVLSAHLYNTLDASKVIEEAAKEVKEELQALQRHIAVFLWRVALIFVSAHFQRLY